MRLALVVVVIAVIAAGCGGDSESTPATTPEAAAPPATMTTETAPPPTVPEDEPAKEQLPPIPSRDPGAAPPHPELFFLFPAEEDARAAAAELEEHDYRVRTAPPADDVPDWSVIAEGTPDTPDLRTAEQAFGAWARARDGRYDGNEIPVGP